MVSLVKGGLEAHGTIFPSCPSTETLAPIYRNRSKILP